MKIYLYISLFVIIGLIMGFLLGRNSNITASNEDKIFIEQMIPHHEEAVRMAKQELGNGQSAELKDLSNNIITAQTKEINQMKDWYKKWYGIDYPIKSTMMPEDKDLGSLSNRDLDKKFVASMIMHHQSAISMAKIIEQSTRRPELKKIARNIINSQQDEITRMERIQNIF